MKLKYIILIMTGLFLGNNTWSQDGVRITGGHLVQNGGYLVVKDANFINNADYSASAGTVVMKGTASDANSMIAGTSTTTFHNLTINKSSNNVILGNNVNIDNNVSLLLGFLDIQDNDLTINSSASMSDYSFESFVKTSGVGTLIREVGSSAVDFPVGASSYTPASLTNLGTTDWYDIRVLDEVYTDGTSGSVVTADNLDVTWFINESTIGGSNVNLTLQWYTLNELSGFDRNNCFISRYDGSDWIEHTSGAAAGSNPYTTGLASITAFSPFTVSSNINTLPVELLEFNARKEEQKVRLDWITATEINNHYFDVEWSRDGFDFEKIGEMQGAGDTQWETYYSHYHNEPQIGLNYYRLKQVDFDGTFEYSDIRSILFSKSDQSGMTLFPNPTKNYIYIRSDRQGPFEIMDLLGRIIFQGELNGTKELDITQLAAGKYFVRMGNEIESFIVR